MTDNLHVSHHVQENREAVTRTLEVGKEAETGQETVSRSFRCSWRLRDLFDPAMYGNVWKLNSSLYTDVSYTCLTLDYTTSCTIDVSPTSSCPTVTVPAFGLFPEQRHMDGFPWRGNSARKSTE